MSREIKFRAWDKELERMCRVIRIDFRMGKIIAYHPDEEELSPELPLTRFEVVQYTGLKDKNGKEIYEGDIVKTQFDELREDGALIHEAYEHLGVVTWENAKIVSKSKNAVYKIYPTSEVIGNIYEHPHLLKEAESNVQA